MATNTEQSDMLNIKTNTSSDNSTSYRNKVYKLLEKDTSFNDIQEIFQPIRDKMAKEQEFKEGVRSRVNKLDDAAHDLYTALQQIHIPTASKIAEILKTAESITQEVKEKLSDLKEQVGVSYYKYNNMWSSSMTRIVSCLSLIHFLKNGSLLTLSEAASLLEIGDHKSSHVFMLDIEDYLSGILNLASELSRYSVNSVSQGDLSRPFQIVTFLSEMDAGFKLLVFKNDSLRRKFDGLKYDIKKTEDVVYDLTIRGFRRETVNSTTIVTSRTLIENSDLPIGEVGSGDNTTMDT